MGGLVMTKARMPMPGPIGPMPYQENVTVIVLTDTTSQDEPEKRYYNNISSIEVNRNGDLLLWGSQGLTFPTYGWTAGSWVHYSVEEQPMPFRRMVYEDAEPEGE
jgi:hypothetical protein